MISILLFQACKSKYAYLSDTELCERYNKSFRTSEEVYLNDEIKRRLKIKYETTKDGVEYYTIIKQPPCLNNIGRAYETRDKNGKLIKIIQNQAHIDLENSHKIKDNTLNGLVVYDYYKDKKEHFIKDWVRSPTFCDSHYCIKIKNDTVKLESKFKAEIRVSEPNHYVEYYNIKITKGGKFVKILTNIDVYPETKKAGVYDSYYQYEEDTSLLGKGIHTFEGIVKIKLKKSSKEEIHSFSYKYIVI